MWAGLLEDGEEENEAHLIILGRPARDGHYKKTLSGGCAPIRRALVLSLPCGEVVSLGDTGINDIPVGVRKLREVSAAGDSGSSRKADCNATLPEELRPRPHRPLVGKVLERASVGNEVEDAHEFSMKQITPKTGVGNTSVVDASSVVASIRAFVPATARRRWSTQLPPMSRSTLRLQRRLSRSG